MFSSSCVLKYRIQDVLLVLSLTLLLKWSHSELKPQTCGPPLWHLRATDSRQNNIEMRGREFSASYKGWQTTSCRLTWTNITGLQPAVRRVLRDVCKHHLQLCSHTVFSFSPSTAPIVVPLCTFDVNIRLTSLDHQSLTLLLDLNFVECPFKVSVWLNVVVSSFKALINKNVHTNGVSLLRWRWTWIFSVSLEDRSLVLERLSEHYHTKPQGAWWGGSGTRMPPRIGGRRPGHTQELQQ